MKILIPHAHWDCDRFFSTTLERLLEKADVQLNDSEESMSSDDVAEVASDLDILVTGWGAPVVTPEILKAATQLKLIAVLGGTLRPHQPEMAFEQGIRF